MRMLRMTIAFGSSQRKRGEELRPEINQILEGNFEYETGNIEFSCSRIEIELEDSSVYEGEFSILASLDRPFHGTVTSSDHRMVCHNPQFEENEAVIHFSFDASYMRPGDVEKGCFYVVSNQGEGYLSYVVSIIHKVPNSSLGHIRNLFHFANLAKSNWDEALNLFYKKEFEAVFAGVDRKYYDAYKSLSVYNGNEQNMEEFLLYINKKQVISYTPHTYQMEFENIGQIQGNEISLTKNGWGYTFLKIETEGDFLSVEHSFLTGENFLGNYCNLLFYIHLEGLHDGNNYGKIIFSNSFTSFEVTISVKQKAVAQKNTRERRERQRHILSLMEYYQAFRLKQISSATWLKETSRLVDKMLLNNETDTAARLFQAQILITENRVNEARWVLDKAEQLFVKEATYNRDLYAYYLYLTSLNSREEVYVNKVTDMITSMYEETPNDWYIAWLLLFLSEDFSRNSYSKWLFLEEQFYKGANSPLFYIEAFLLMNVAPNFLTKLDAFEVQVLIYGAKKRIISKDLMRQFHYLLEKNKDFDPLVYKVLVTLYEMYGDESTLYHICSMLIRGNRTDNAYFKWYEMAVEKSMKITKLYEFYMLSADKSNLVLLPRIVLMYFNYNSNLDYKTNAYLYACIYKFADKIGELWENYRPQIERFVLDQITKDHINKNLAYLYKNIFSERMLNEDYASHMAPLLFAHLISLDKKDCETKTIRNVVVKSKFSREEEIYPVKNGQAIVYLYGTENTISFEDAYKNRYMDSVNYITEKMLLPTKMARLIAPYVQNCIGFDGYICELYKDSGNIEENNVERYVRLMRAPHLQERYKQRIKIALLQYYYEKDRIEEMDSILETIEGSELDVDMRNEVIRLFILRGMLKEAYDFIKEFGIAGLDVKTLFRIVSRQIGENPMEEDYVLLSLAHICFKKGKYDVNILQYLVLHFEGLSKEMRDIWQAAEAFDVDTNRLCQRCLEQILFSGAYLSDVLEMYQSYKKGFVEPELEHALLAQWSYDYFIKDKLVPSYVFLQMAKLVETYEFLLVEKLALIKFFAENPEQRTAESLEVIKGFVREMLGNDMFLPCFLEFVDEVPELRVYADKIFVEYKGSPYGKAVLHYMIALGDGEGGEYRTEEMRNIYGGVYCKEFLLFYGESLQYYIMEEVDGKEQLTESATIQKSDVAKSGDDSRYSMLNDIAISKTMQDYETLDEMLEEYYRKTYLVDSLFGMGEG